MRGKGYFATMNWQRLLGISESRGNWWHAHAPAEKPWSPVGLFVMFNINSNWRRNKRPGRQEEGQEVNLQERQSCLPSVGGKYCHVKLAPPRHWFWYQQWSEHLKLWCLPGEGPQRSRKSAKTLVPLTRTSCSKAASLPPGSRIVLCKTGTSNQQGVSDRGVGIRGWAPTTWSHSSKHRQPNT